MPNQRIFEEFFLGHKVKHGLEGEADDGNISPVLVLGKNDSGPVIRKSLSPIGFDLIKNGENQSGNPSGQKINNRTPSHHRSIVYPKVCIIELRKSNGTLSILLHPPHRAVAKAAMARRRPPLSPDYGGEDKGEGVLCDGNLRSIIYVKVNHTVIN